MNNTLIEKLPSVRKIASAAELEALRAYAREDNHEIFRPTHLILKNGEIVGCFGIGLMLQYWLHSKKCSARDSLHVQGQIESILKEHGICEYCMPCSPESPYLKHMESFGFKYMGDAKIFRRRLV